MRGSSNEADGATLQVGEENILLRFVEAMNLVDEENGRFITKFLPRGGLLDFCSNLGNVGFHSIERLEARAGGIGNDRSQGRLTSARWAVKDQGGEPISLDRSSEEFAFG